MQTESAVHFGLRGETTHHGDIEYSVNYAGVVLVGDRCTLAFGNPDGHPDVKEYIAANLGKKVQLRVDSLGVAVEVFAVGVTGDFKSTIERPHIPVAVPPGGHSKNSNLIKTWKDYTPKFVLYGIVDTFPRMFP